MEGKMAETALSWQEVQDICVEMEKLYRKDAQKDAKRLRALKQKRVEIAVTVESKQTESKKQLQRKAEQQIDHIHVCVCVNVAQARTH
jgi:hypothetical protein